MDPCSWRVLTNSVRTARATADLSLTFATFRSLDHDFPFEIKKLAYRKGCVAERTMTVSGKPYVRLTDPKGREIDCARRDIGFSLIEAKRHLEALPDHSRDQRGTAANRSAPQPN